MDDPLGDLLGHLRLAAGCRPRRLVGVASTRLGESATGAQRLAELGAVAVERVSP